jgi:hypothetical protein
MNARPGAGSGLAGLLRGFTPALFACAFLVATLAVPARAAGETTINFDDLPLERRSQASTPPRGSVVQLILAHGCTR